MFMLDDLAIDRIVSGVALNSDDTELLYHLSQLADATIATTSDKKEINDANGTTIKVFHRGKKGTLTANNALLNLSILGAQTGVGKNIATTDNAIVMPKIITVAPGDTVTLKDFVPGSVIVSEKATNGALGKQYALGTAASDTEFAVTTAGAVSLPTDKTVDHFMIFYKRKVTSGVKITNSANKYAGSVHLILKALAIDPCTPSALRGVYIDVPSFQVSPDVSIKIGGSDTQQLEYNGDLQLNYCSENKELYSVMVAEDDIEQEG